MLPVLCLLSLAATGLGPSELIGTSIVVAGQSFEVGRPVVLWGDRERGFDGYAPHCLEQRARAQNPCCASYELHYRARPPEQRTLAELQRRLRLIVLHHDGCANSRTCFYIMHDGCKKRSAHFMIDNDGTIYQTLDVAEIAFHARLVNDVSIGIELCNLARPEGRLPEEYARRPMRRVRIKGEEIEAFDFRPEQYDSVAALTRTLLRIFPGIAAEVPLNEAGKPHLDSLSAPRQRSGIVGHVHVDDIAGKWDPGAFRWLDFLDALTGPFLPLEVDGFDRFPTANPARAAQVAQAAFAHAERGSSAQFPVQAGGLIHSGINLRGRSGAPVLAPAAGVILAARLADGEATSRSFVLMRHDVELDGRGFAFFSLLYYLRPDVLALARPPGWLQRVADRDPRARLALEQGQTLLLHEPVAAGEPVGFLGGARRGPGPTLRFEIFTAEPPPEEPFWRRVLARESGPFWRAGGLAGLLDRPGDLPTAADIRRQFGAGTRSSGRARALRGLVVEHVHEWSSHLGEAVYQSAPELSALYPGERRRVYEVVAGPHLFLTPELARHAGLPEDHVVHSYNPIAFLHWLSARMGGGPLPPPAGVPASPDVRPRRLLTEVERREPWLDYLDPPPAGDTGSYYLRLVEIPIRVKRRHEMPLLDVTVGNHASSEDR